MKRIGCRAVERKKMAIELLYFQLSTSEEEITLDGISADLGELGFVGILSC